MSVWTGTNKPEKREVAVPRPSASILLISPKNQILLLHRVKTSSSFPSAHVFPGGNVDSGQDGELPPASDFACHEDGPAYRLAAIRECFEESGVLLARTGAGVSGGGLLAVGEAERESARRAVHSQEARFVDWVRARGGEPDVAGLHAFTRFITPTTVPRRFTTQMYLYFLPLEDEAASADPGVAGHGVAHAQRRGDSTTIPVPTSDGGVEHTTAAFAWPEQWLTRARANDIIVYPPQAYLLHLIAPFFVAPPAAATASQEGSDGSEGSSAASWDRAELEAQRRRCLDFLQTSNPPWADKVMSPDVVAFISEHKKAVLGLKKPGPELEGSGRSGDDERVVLVRNTKEGPRDVEVRWKAELLRDQRMKKNTAEKGKM